MADVKRRTAARAWATRSKNALLDLLGTKDISYVALSEKLEDLEKRLKNLDQVQETFELSEEVEDLDAEIEAADDFRKGILDVKIRACEVKQALESAKGGSADSVDGDDSGSVDGSAASSAGSVSRAEAKLPKLSLPKFSGNTLEWFSFWDQFVAIIDRSSMATVSKFAYLEAQLTGDAADAIAGLAMTAANYEVACDILQQRFGRTELVRFSHIQELLNLAPLGRQASISELRKLNNKLLSHIRCLENLGISGKEYGVVLTPIVLSCLPHSIRLEWARESEDKESDLEWLLEFLEKEIENRERCDSFKEAVKYETKRESQKTKQIRGPSTASALNTVSGRPNGRKSKSQGQVYSETCGVCSRGHPTSKCWTLVKSDLGLRRSVLRNKGLCFKCLGKGHLASDCDVVCSKCSGDHNFLLCRGNSAETSASRSEAVSHTGVATRVDSSAVVMQVLTVKIAGPNGLVSANVLLDSGSDKTYISSALVRKCRPNFVGTEFVSCAGFGSGKVGKRQMRNVYSVDLKGRNQGAASMRATEIDVISVPIHRKKIPVNVLRSFSQLDLVSNYEVDERLSIDILIGLDNYWQVVLPEFESSSVGIVAQKTIFGWMLSGVLPAKEQAETSVQLLCIGDVSDSDVRKFWEIDYEISKVDSPVLEEFNRNVNFDNGRYVVALPWTKTSKGEVLVNNFEMAVNRLKSLSKKLTKNPELHEGYDEALREMESSGVIEEVPSEEVHCANPTFYLPHRPVVRESSSSTKIRPVFDASAKGLNKVSLNDCMEKGPNLIPNLVQILVRFRKWPIALVADIKKAFLQIAVQKVDQDVHRFLWELDGQLRIMRIVRVPFGNRASPFLLNATIRHHLGKYEPSRVISELQKNLYVDDWLTGADSVSEAKSMVDEASSVLSEAHMELAKWGSNAEEVFKSADYHLSDKSESGENVKILGLYWNRTLDCFSYEGLEISEDIVLTKRMVLSFIARLFDPLGFVTPFVVRLKCVFQQLWKLGLEWDAEIPECHKKIVEDWLSDISSLKNWHIPRPYFQGQWKNVMSVELHGFGDSSEIAYGACVYVVTRKVDGVMNSALVISKAKVAPLKKVTLPRLELLGAVLAAQLLDFVRESLGLTVDDCFAWSDSMVVLNWIKGDSGKWKPFIANRISEIHRLTNPSQWKHCPSAQNPADLLTRGMSAAALVGSHLWLNGPSLMFDREEVPEVNSSSQCDVAEEELLHQEAALTAVSSTAKSKLFELERWGSLQKCVSVVAWVHRFIHNCRSSLNDRRLGNLSYAELEGAKTTIFKYVQQIEYAEEIAQLERGDGISRKSSLYKLAPFFDDTGILRVKSRLEFSNLTFNEKCPIIVPKGHLAKLIVCFQHQLLKHGGVSLMLTSLRNTYWIIGARRLAKSIKNSCFNCQRVDKKACSQPTAPLPDVRVQKSAPFSVIGIDHAGPLYCSDRPGQKQYILLITCGVVRALHLELVNSLGVEDCVLALRKFIARRGIPSIIYSDNAKTFGAAHGQLQKLYGVLCPDWRFIVPRAPWWGGWWERLVRTVKAALRKSVGTRSLTHKELDTLLVEIEACVNSRPLTTVYDSPDDWHCLTPAQFLIGRKGMYEPGVDTDTSVSATELIDRKVVQDSVLSQFWDFWSNNYLRNLVPWTNRSKPTSIKVGNIVLVSEDNQPRLSWPIGIVTETYPGRDGVIRSCKIKTSRSEFLRPIQKLYQMEFAECADKETNDAATDNNVRYTRLGRKVKRVERFDGSKY